jgi:hypothetical protein
MQQSSKVWIIVIIFLVVACLCMCAVAAISGAAFFIIRDSEQSSDVTPFSWDEEPVQPTRQPTSAALATAFPDNNSTVESTPAPASDGAYQTLEDLQAVIVPNNDPIELAGRLKGITDIPSVIPVTKNYQVGSQETFWVSDVDTNENFQVDATLRYVTDSAYFWIEDGVDYDEDELSALAETFNNQIYPTDREFFGSEWKPGIDGDDHIYILYARGLGSSIAGYFSSADSLPPQAHPYSNAHEMFLFNADTTGLGEEFTYGVLAHEFQHMIHWYRDRNEESWMNEGFSEVASFLNGYDNGGFDYLFTMDPDLQLNDWPNNSDETTPHYGASFMFLTYFLDRFGEDATKTLVAEPENGFTSIDKILGQLNLYDDYYDRPVTADWLFADWAVTNYINQPQAADGRYSYNNYPSAPTVYDTEKVNECSTGWEPRTVHQYGSDYINLGCQQDLTLTFQGSSEVGVIPEDANSGDYAMWSNKGDESDMTLSQTFDFTSVTGPLTLQYSTWYDIEQDYDYVYLVASTDGQTWDILEPDQCSSDNPTGNSYGCGYTGVTDGYIQESVDLSQFAGQQVTLRFEYITDAAVNGEGFLLDDVSIPEIDYTTDFETDNGGWDAQGFVRLQNRLPQTFAISLIYLSDNTTVESYLINPGETLTLDVPAYNQTDVILVVSGTTRFTRQEAAYRFKLAPAE